MKAILGDTRRNRPVSRKPSVHERGRRKRGKYSTVNKYKYLESEPNREPTTIVQPDLHWESEAKQLERGMAFSSRTAIIAGGLGESPSLLIPGRLLTRANKTGGIGTRVALSLRAQNARLALLYAPFEASRVKPTLRDVFSTTTENADIRAYECDITSPTSVDSAFAAINADFNNQHTRSDALVACPSILVNAAGYVALSPLEETDAADMVKHFNVNLLGPMLVSQAFARMYFAAGIEIAESKTKHKALPPGRIVSIASQAAHVALDQHGAYCASKAGLVGLTRCMASEWARTGITANTVSPGPVWTELGKKAWGNDEVRAEYLRDVPTGMLAEPEEVAEAILFLCSDGAGSINGADVRLDGGFTAR